ncbi:tyrosine phosphatase family protein [Allorhizobium undicola]|uniref:tyrosine phosphatase family protein n=1 Tax=Allorhizobium undicola TaxID=78527 RepID=UPI000483D0AE|nr:tyrosine phosphatase family protein [Allorhizobium undicola]
MSFIIVSPLARIAEMAVRHGARDMLSLMAENHDFHRPAVIDAARHLKLHMNDISFAGTGKLIAPQQDHVRQIIAFAESWNQATPLLIHCWMGVSRSPAAAVIASLCLYPKQDDEEIAQRLRRSSPFATPNIRLIEFADAMLGRQGRLVAAIRALGRGQDADGNAPFVFALQENL